MIHTISDYQPFAFVVRCTCKKHVFPLHQVIRLEARSNYTMVFSTYQRPLLVAKVLAGYEKILLHQGFIRVHRSHLVNKQHVDGLDSKGNIILLDNSRIEISRRKKKEVRQKLQSRIR